MHQIIGPIQSEIDLFERRLEGKLRSDVESVHQVARYLATQKGKRLRPALVVLCAKATGRWDDRVIDACVGVEMIHAATMVHDDVVDEAATRRGAASVNARWDNRTAVLMGDFLLARALCLLVELGHQEALLTVARATERLSQGEIHEDQIGSQVDTREQSYLDMVSDKTASLIAAACKIGPLLVGAPTPIVEALARYGESLGLAFQIADDMLDFTGDAATLGKPVGCDLREGKITLPLIHSLAAAPQAERAAVEALLRQEHKSEDDWCTIVGFVEKHDGLGAADDTARRYAARALECLEILEPSTARTALEAAVKLVVERDS